MLLYLALGTILLIAGAEGLVRGAAALAARMRVPPLLIGLTVVALGTSSPEVVVTVRAALAGYPGLAVGNVVGSNLFNILFILGLAALIGTLRVTAPVIRRDVPLLIAASLLTLGFALNGSIGRGEGLVLLTLAVVYTLHLAGAGIRASQTARDDSRALDRKEGRDPLRSSVPPGSPGVLVSILLVAAGTGALIWGASWVVTGATELAAVFGVPEPIVGLTVLAVGTSLPEIATSVTAALRGRGDLAVGNIVGSNLYNLFLVLGVGAVLSPVALEIAESLIRFDVPLMLGAAIALLPFAATGHRIDRWEGGVFLFYWLAYMALLVLEVLGHPVRDSMWVLFAAFLVPITLVTLGVVGMRVIRGEEDPAADEHGEEMNGEVG